MLKSFRLFLVLAVMVSFTAFLSGNTVLAGTQLDLAGFHNGKAVKSGIKMLDRGEKRDLVAMVKYATDTNTEVEDAIFHAFKESRPQNIDYNIEDSTVQNARDEFKQAKSGVGKYINELTRGSWHLKKAISSAEMGEEKVAMLHAKSGFALIKQCQIDLKAMGVNKLQQVPDNYDLTAVGIEVSY